MKWLWIVDGNLWLCEILTLKNITKTGKSHVGVGVVLNSLDWENPWKSKPNCNLPTALHRQLACITTCQQLISTALAAPLVKALVEKLKTEIEIKAALEVAEALPFRLRVFPQGSPNKALQNRLVLCVFFYGSYITDHMCHVCLLVYCPIFNVIWFFSHKSTTSHSTILSITSSSIAVSFLLGARIALCIMCTDMSLQMNGPNSLLYKLNMNFLFLKSECCWELEILKAFVFGKSTPAPALIL